MLEIALIAAILFRMLLPRMKRSGNPFVRELARDYGVRASGPDGRWTRGDRARAAVWCAIGTAALFAISSVAITAAERRPGTPAENWGMGVMFVSAILGIICAVSGVAHLVRVPFAKPLPGDAPTER